MALMALPASPIRGVPGIYLNTPKGHRQATQGRETAAERSGNSAKAAAREIRITTDLQFPFEFTVRVLGGLNHCACICDSPCSARASCLGILHETFCGYLEGCGSPVQRFSALKIHSLQHQKGLRCHCKFLLFSSFDLFVTIVTGCFL